MSPEPSLDHIDLYRPVFSAIGSSFTSDEFRSIASGSSFGSVDSTDRIIYLKSTGDIYYDADGSGGGSAPIRFADLAANSTVTFGSFELFT